MSEGNISKLEDEYNRIALRLNLKDKEDELSGLIKESEEPDFWSDNRLAQETMKKIAILKQRLDPWTNVRHSIDELKELDGLDDADLKSEIEAQIEVLNGRLKDLREELKLSGKYDEYDALVSIYAGAGGTDAQDWTEMLYRMYSRWAEKNGYSFKLLDQNNGEEAGLKSVSIDISGPFAYGKLKGESGVHRLVRLSPFNADNLRQTSFAKVEVLPKIDQPSEVEIADKELKVDVFRSGGHGGQSVNTTDSAVRLTHLPTGITVVIQNERSQLQNKELAMTILRSKLAQLQIEQHTDQISALKGPNVSAEWGNQIRSYVLHPYKQVKDLRTGYESKEPDRILDGDLEGLIEAYLDHTASLKQ